MTNDALLQAAITAARAGDLEEAAILFARLVKEEPSSEQGWLGLGFCFSDKKRREYCFQRVLAINPNNQPARQALGLLENPISAQAPTIQSQPSPAPATGSPEFLTKSAVSPFLAEDDTGPKKDEPDIKQTGTPRAIVQEAGKEEKKEQPVPVSPELLHVEKEAVRPVQKPGRKVKPLVLILLLTFITSFSY